LVLIYILILCLTRIALYTHDMYLGNTARRAFGVPAANVNEQLKQKIPNIIFYTKLCAKSFRYDRTYIVLYCFNYSKWSLIFLFRDKRKRGKNDCGKWQRMTDVRPSRISILMQIKMTEIRIKSMHIIIYVYVLRDARFIIIFYNNTFHMHV